MNEAARANEATTTISGWMFEQDVRDYILKHFPDFGIREKGHVRIIEDERGRPYFASRNWSCLGIALVYVHENRGKLIPMGNLELGLAGLNRRDYHLLAAIDVPLGRRNWTTKVLPSWSESQRNELEGIPKWIKVLEKKKFRGLSLPETRKAVWELLGKEFDVLSRGKSPCPRYIVDKNRIAVFKAKNNRDLIHALLDYLTDPNPDRKLPQVRRRQKFSSKLKREVLTVRAEEKQEEKKEEPCPPTAANAFEIATAAKSLAEDRINHALKELAKAWPGVTVVLTRNGSPVSTPLVLPVDIVLQLTLRM
jgi:hypothetical protein